MSKLKSRLPLLHEELRSKGTYLHDIQNFTTKAQIMKKSGVFRITLDIPVGQISKSGDVRALFGDADCELLPALLFIDESPTE